MFGETDIGVPLSLMNFCNKMYVRKDVPNIVVADETQETNLEDQDVDTYVPNILSDMLEIESQIDKVNNVSDNIDDAVTDPVSADACFISKNIKVHDVSPHVYEGVSKDVGHSKRLTRCQKKVESRKGVLKAKRTYLTRRSLLLPRKRRLPRRRRNIWGKWLLKRNITLKH